MIRAVAVLLVLMSAIGAAGQTTTPQLTKPQRDTLRRIVEAVELASGEPETPGATWRVHLLRASDGSHYVAFAVDSSDISGLKTGSTILYVRLATAALGGTGAERSAVAEWLSGRRADPRLRPPTAIAIGDMPNYGAGAIAVRGSTASTGSNDLKLMALERERARQEKEERDKQRRAELEGLERQRRELYPFEDFDVAASLDSSTGALQRALTAGPGDYELYVGWADASAKAPAAVRVLKHSLHLPPASASELAISSIIVADQVSTRATAYPPAQQSAHPYTVGLTEIVPARDTVLSRDERLTIAFQVINARASDLGKPDVSVTFRIVRVTGDREQPVATLTPQQYNAGTLPEDFDLRMGHPIFAAMSAPLTTLSRGDYRLKVAVTDRIAGRGTGGETDFRVVGTPLSLLAEAPSLGVPFRREMALEPAVIDAVAAKLQPAAPSPALARALDTLRQRHFVELMREEPVEPGELGLRTALTAVARFALGDASSPVQVQRSIQLNAPPGPGLFFLGAARAIEGREADAVVAWEAAIENGMPAGIVTPLLVNAHLRRGDTARAAALLGSRISASDWSREHAALLIATGREADAVPILERRLASQPDDVDAEWLLLHALFASIVHAPASQPATGSAEKFTQAAQAYLAHERPNAALVAEWLKVVAPAAKP